MHPAAQRGPDAIGVTAVALPKASAAVAVAAGKDSPQKGVRVSLLVDVQRRLPLMVRHTKGSGRPPGKSQALPAGFFSETWPRVTVITHWPVGSSTQVVPWHTKPLVQPPWQVGPGTAGGR